MIVELLITLLLGEVLITKLKRNYINGNMIILATLTPMQLLWFYNQNW
jgi:hypothetical protein